MIIIHLLFVVSALFFVLVLGFSAALWLKVCLNLRNSFKHDEQRMHRRKSFDDDKVIQGEYKIIDETHKE